MVFRHVCEFDTKGSNGDGISPATRRTPRSRWRACPPHDRSSLWLWSLFVPAGLLLLANMLQAGLSDRLFALGFFLLLIEQARMAQVDLHRLATVAAQLDDPRLRRFGWVTQSTIAIELAGFYLAGFYLGWGAIVILTSQVWFHLLAGVELHPDTPEPIRPCGPWQRPALLADLVSIGLVVGWLRGIAPVMMAALLLAMVLAYGSIKYLPPLAGRLAQSRQ